MKKIVKLIPVFLLIPFLGCNLSIAQSMSQKNYYIQKTLAMKDGLNFVEDTEFGIKSKSSQPITVNMYSKLLLDRGDKKIDAFLYGFKSTGNTGENYENTNYTIVQDFPGTCLLSNCIIKSTISPRDFYDKNSNSIKDFRARTFDDYIYEKKTPLQQALIGSLGGVTKMNLDVVVEIVLENGTGLSDVLGIKLPGLKIDELKGEKFPPTTFAFIGNYGCSARQGAQDVSNLIKTKIKPDVIISAGNDSYHNLYDGGCGTGFADNTGKLYNQWVETKRFKSVLGNMDYEDGNKHHLGLAGEQAWKTYFGNSELNYSVAYDLPYDERDAYKYKIEFFMINTTADNNGLQATKNWLIGALAASQARYKIVVGHHAPYASGQTASVLQSWNFRDMGADMYISSGPDFYERHDVNGIPYVNVGLGGFTKNTTDYSTSGYPPTMVKKTHYADNFGTLKASVGKSQIRFEFLTTTGQKVDEFYIFGWEKNNPGNNYYLEKLRGTPISSSNINKDIDVYLILGQSNAAGRCGWVCFREFIGEYSGELKNSYLLNEKNEFELAKNSFARYSTVEKYVFNSGLGVGWSFAKTINAAMPTKKLGFISNARGGVGTEEWFPDYVVPPGVDYSETTIGYTPGNNLYQETKKRFLAMQKKYPKASLKGIIWMEGENDVYKVNKENYDYAGRTKELIRQFRVDYKLPNLKFLIPEVSRRYDAILYGDWTHTKLNEQINSLHDPANNIYVTDVEGLTTFDNINVHWDIASYYELGIRLARLVLPAKRNERLAASMMLPKSYDAKNGALYNDLRIYPNPSKDGDFTLEFGLEQEGSADLEIVNLSGLLVYNKKYANLEKGNHKLYLEKGDTNLSSGIYIVKLVTNEFTETSKLVVD